MDRLRLKTPAALHSELSRLSVLKRPRSVALGPALRRALTARQAWVLRRFWPVCGCTAGAVTLYAVLAAAVVHVAATGLSGTGVALWLGGAVAASLVAKASVLVATFLVLRRVGESLIK